MKNKLYLLSSLIVCAIALAFIPIEDEKIHISLIHHEDGQVQMYDTIFDAASGYSVEQFIKDKGLNPEETEIIETEAMMEGFRFDMSDHEMIFEEIEMEGEEGEQVFIVKELTNENGKEQEVTIQKKVDENGNVTIEKTVNGEKVEIDADEFEMEMDHEMIFIPEGAQHKVIRIDSETEGDEIKIEIDGKEFDVQKVIEEATQHIDSDDAEVIIIKQEIDDEGNVTIEKTVNGEVVEGDLEEMENVWIEEHGEDANHKVIKIKREGDNEEDVQIHIDMEGEEGEIATYKTQTIIKEMDEDGNVVITETSGDEEVDVQVFVTKDGQKLTDGDKQVKVMAYTYEINTDSSEPVVMRSKEDGPSTIAIVTRISGDEEAESQNQFSSDVAKLPIENLNFYPNPSDGKLRLSFFLPQRGKTVINVFDINGKRVYKKNLGNFEGAFDKELDLTDLESGTYILRITQNNLSLAEQLIVN